MSRRTLTILLVAVGHALAFTSPVVRAQGPVSVDRLEAILAVQAAQRKLHRYRFIDYPQAVRDLDDAIRLAEAEVSVLSARVEHYRPFRSFKDLAPTFTAEQTVRLHRLAAVQHLRRLKAERNLVGGDRREVIKSLQLEQLAALKRLAAVSAQQQ